MENPIKMDDLGVPLFLETAIFLSYTQMQPLQILRSKGVVFCQPVGWFLDSKILGWEVTKKVSNYSDVHGT